MTALYDAVAVALDHLKKGKWDKKVLTAISDGGDNASKHKLAEILSMVNQSSAILYTMGIFDDNDDDLTWGVLATFQISRRASFRKLCRKFLPI